MGCNVPLKSAPLEHCNGCHGLVFTPTPGGEASSSLTAAEWDRSHKRALAAPEKRPLTNRCTVAEATDVARNVPLESAPLEHCNGCHGLVFTPTPGATI